MARKSSAVLVTFPTRGGTGYRLFATRDKAIKFVQREAKKRPGYNADDQLDRYDAEEYACAHLGAWLQTLTIE